MLSFFVDRGKECGKVAREINYLFENSNFPSFSYLIFFLDKSITFFSAHFFVSRAMSTTQQVDGIELGPESVVITGAGLAGSLLACKLRQKGLDVHVLERRPDPRKASLQVGRSINLALSERGINAIRDVGILEDILSITIPMYGRGIHPLGTPQNRLKLNSKKFIFESD